jgi:hypothetical protein
MSKRKIDFIFDDKENVGKKPKTEKTEKRTPLRKLIQNKIMSKIGRLKPPKDSNPKNEDLVRDDLVLFDEEVQPSTSQNTGIGKQEADCSDEIILVDEVSSTTSKESPDNKANMQQMSLKQIKKIKEILKITKSNGESVIGGEASELPILPGLFVRNFGDVSIPLCSQQAEDLIKVCKQASFGLKSENLANFGNLYELEPSQIQIKNSSWNQSLNKLVEKVATDLGCVGKVVAKLHKMLLYKQGGHFNKQRNIMKEKGVFGTLIIQLPSNYTGGEVIVYDNSDSPFKYDFGQSNGKSGYSVHYAAHYSDLEHEILEVTSGYRSVLVYDLCWESGNGVCLNDGSSVASMASSLSILNESFVPLALFLDEKYTDDSFQENGIKALKGVDSQRFNLLEKASSRLPDYKKLNFYVISASLKVVDPDFRRLYFYNKYSNDETENDFNYDVCLINDINNYGMSQTKKIECMFDSNGRLYKDPKIDLSYFAEIIDVKKDFDRQVDINNVMEWGKYTSIEREEYAGCASPVTLIYQKYFLMILPKSKSMQLAFGLSFSHGVDKVLEFWDFQSDSTDKVDFNDSFKFLLSSLKRKIKGNGFRFETTELMNDDQINKILDILVHLDDVCLAQFFMDNCYNKYTEKHCGKVAGLIKKFGFQTFKASLKEFIQPKDRKSVSYNFCLMQVRL